MSAWREAWDRADRSRAERGSFVDVSVDDRLALARELLAGTGWVVAREVDWLTADDTTLEWTIARVGGWNACRAAMLGEGE